MSLSKTLLLGFVAGVTIVLGMPIGRMRRPAPGLRAFLNAVAVGILLFLVWDVLSQAWEPIDGALGDYHDHHGGLAPAFGYGALLAGGLAAGLLALVAYERWMDRVTGEPEATVVDPGPPRAATGTTLVAAPARTGLATWSPARQLALLIAVGIGLHNFAEGLAIGQAAARSEISFVTLLVVGFALHNATEGFGIVAPLGDDLAADGSGAAPPTWGFLATLAVIGGGPTFVGTAVGHAFTSEAVSVAFLSLAAGSIVYVVLQLVAMAGRTRRTDLLVYGVLIGLLAGFVTDAIVTAAGV